jgi:hypothetical protein
VAARSTSNEEAELWNKLVQTANKLSDGHLTVMKFKRNWRVGFFTPNKREDIDLMAAGKTFADAARMALQWTLARHTALAKLRPFPGVIPEYVVLVLCAPIRGA